MGLTKRELFTEEQNHLAQLAKAFAHPARIAILQQLFKRNACICGDLVEELGLAQSTISQHLRELKKVGIIHGTIEGVSVCYCINPIKWKEVKTLLNAMFEQYKSSSEEECC